MSRAIVVRSGRASDRDLVETAVGEVFKVRGDEAALRGADVVVVAYEKLREVLPRLDESRPVVVLADLVPATAAPPIAHVVRRDAGVEPLRALLLSIAEQRPLFSAPAAPPETEADARRIQRAFAASRRLAAVSDLAASEGVMVDAVVELTGADRAYCLFHDADDGSIWSEQRRATPAGDERRAIAGLAGFAARTGLAVQADRAEDDPRWVASIDDPSGDEAARPALGRVRSSGTPAPDTAITPPPSRRPSRRRRCRPSCGSRSRSPAAPPPGRDSRR